MSQSVRTVDRALDILLCFTREDSAGLDIGGGIVLAGGGALLRGVDKLLTKSLGIPAYLVDNPMTCVVEGASRGLGMMNILRRNLPQV